MWIEVDREAIADAFISADDLVTRWNQDGNRGHTIMPRIEAAHIGDIALSAFRAVFLTWADGDEVREIEMLNLERADLDQVLGDWRAG